MFKEVSVNSEDLTAECLKDAREYRKGTLIALGRAFINFKILPGEGEITDEDLLLNLGEYFLLLVLQSLSDPPQFQIGIPPELIQRLCHAKWKPTIEFRILKYANSHRTYIEEFILYMRRFGEDMVINHIPEVLMRATKAINPREVNDDLDLSQAIKRLNEVDTALKAREVLSEIKEYIGSLDHFYAQVGAFLNTAGATLNSVLLLCDPSGKLDMKKFEELTKGFNENITFYLSAFENMNDDLGSFSKDLQKVLAGVSVLVNTDTLQRQCQKYISAIPSYGHHNDVLSEQLRDIQNKMMLVMYGIMTEVSEEQASLITDAKQCITALHETYQSLESKYSTLLDHFKSVTSPSHFAKWKINALSALNKQHLYNLKDRGKMLSELLDSCRSLLAKLLPIENELAIMMNQYTVQLSQSSQLRQKLSDVQAKAPSPHLELLLLFLEHDHAARENQYLKFNATMNNLKSMIQTATQMKDRTKRNLQDLNALVPSNGLNGLLASPQKSLSVKAERVDNNVPDENASEIVLNR